MTPTPRPCTIMEPSVYISQYCRSKICSICYASVDSAMKSASDWDLIVDRRLYVISNSIISIAHSTALMNASLLLMIPHVSIVDGISQG